MLTVFWQRLDNAVRMALPFATAVMCTLLSVMTLPVPYLGTIAPPLALIAIYYWTLHRPDLLRPSMVFIVGLLNDIINDFPLGLSALLFVSAHHFILMQRRFFTGHSFMMTWAGFILTVLVVMICQWLLLCIIRWQGVPLQPVFVPSILAIVLFPIPCWIFIRLQRNVLSQG